MDELAFDLKIDPLKKIPYSSEHLLDCYRTGAETFGWACRKLEPRQVRKGNYFVGYGMATATYPGRRGSTTARIEMTANGRVKVLCATQDFGTGTYTIMAQTAADALGVPIENVAVEIGDSILLSGVPSFAAITAASVTPAALAPGEMLREDLMKLAIADSKSQLFSKNTAEIGFANQKFFIKGDVSKTDSYRDARVRSRRRWKKTATPKNTRSIHPARSSSKFWWTTAWDLCASGAS